MTTYGTEILGQPVGRYVETDEPPGLTLPQTVGGRLWAPMAVMGIMLVATAFALAITRAQLSVDLSEEFTPARKANFEALGQLVPGFMFLGFAMIFAAISFAIARILGVFRTGGGMVQQGIGKGIKTPVMPPTVLIFIAGMLMAMMVLVFAFAGHIYAAVQAHGAWINATGPGAPDAAFLGRAETWGTWLEGLRRFGVGLDLGSIAFGLATIIRLIDFQTLRIRELAQGEHAEDVVTAVAQPTHAESEPLLSREFPGAFYAEDLSSRSVREYIAVIANDDLRVERVIQGPFEGEIAKQRLYDALKRRLKELASRYPEPAFDIVLARGSLEDLESTLSMYGGWSDVTPEDLEVG